MCSPEPTSSSTTWIKSRFEAVASPGRSLTGKPPVLSPEPPLVIRVQHAVGVVRLAVAAVVALQRADQLPLLLVEIEPQDRAAHPEVGLGLEQRVAGLADLLQPERHDLHVALRARARDGEPVEAALDLDHRQCQLRRDARARRLGVEDAQEPEALLCIGNLLLEP